MQEMLKVGEWGPRLQASRRRSRTAVGETREVKTSTDECERRARWGSIGRLGFPPRSAASAENSPLPAVSPLPTLRQPPLQSALQTSFRMIMCHLTTSPSNLESRTVVFVDGIETVERFLWEIGSLASNGTVVAGM